MLAIKPHNKKEGTFMDELIAIRRIEESEAVIKANENVVGIGIWNIGNELKHIRDNKTYTQKGYEDFQEYCEKELNYSRSMAYNLQRNSRRMLRKCIGIYKGLGRRSISKKDKR